MNISLLCHPLFHQSGLGVNRKNVFFFNLAMRSVLRSYVRYSCNSFKKALFEKITVTSHVQQTGKMQIALTII